MEGLQWKAKDRSFGNIIVKQHGREQWQASSTHPLESKNNFGVHKLKSTDISKASTCKDAPLKEKPTYHDPLSAFAADLADQVDIPNAAADDIEVNASKSQRSEIREKWETLSSDTQIWNKTSEKVILPSAFSNFIQLLEKERDANASRLEVLEGKSDSDLARDGLNQAQFTVLVGKMHDQLLVHWREDQRVQALKLIIQAAKLLGDTTVSLRSFPSRFFLLADFINRFGQLVYDRLIAKCPGLKMNFSHEDTTVQAQELAKNWFYKISSIRELLPRFYLETCLLKCYQFLDQHNYPEILDRLTATVRGIADPLVASYARCYLVYCTINLTSLSPEIRQKICLQNFDEFVSAYKYNGIDNVKSLSETSVLEYLEYYTPCIRWLLDGLKITVSTQNQDKIMQTCLERLKSVKHSGLLLDLILRACNISLIEDQIDELTARVTTTNDPAYSKHLLIMTFGKCLLDERLSMKREKKLLVLNAIWKCIMNVIDIKHYLQCVKPWLEFAVRHFHGKEINTILGDVVAHLAKESGPDQYSKEAVAMAHVIFDSKHDVMGALMLGNFLPFFGLFSQTDKVQFARSIMEKVVERVNDPIHDPVSINVLVYLSEVMAENINALTINDEKRQISNFICHAIRIVDYEEDFEEQLRFYTDCRGKFSQLEAVQIELVHRVNALAMRTLQRVSGRHTSRTSAFEKACCAFSFITIPSIPDAIVRFQLYLLSAEVALMNQCLGQAEGSVKAAITMIPELTKGTQKLPEQKLTEVVSSLLSLLLIVPDNVDNGVLYLVRGTLNAINRSTFDQSNIGQSALYIKVLQLLSVITWQSLPYHINGIDSNDTLYGGDELYVEEVNKIATKVLDQIMDHLKYLAEIGANKKQAELSWLLFQCIVGYGDLDPKLATLALNLWKTAAKNNELLIQMNKFTNSFEPQNDEENMSLLLQKIRKM